MLEKKPFRSYTLEEDKEDKKDGAVTITLWLNAAEQKQLIKDKNKLQQTKDGTAIKQLMALGSKLLGNSLTGDCLSIVIENKRKNKRLNIVDFEE